MKSPDSFKPNIEITLPEIKEVVRSFLEDSQDHGIKCTDLEETISGILFKWIVENKSFLIEELCEEEKNFSRYQMPKLFSAIYKILDPTLAQDRIPPDKRNGKNFALNAWVYSLFPLFRDKFSNK